MNTLFALHGRKLMLAFAIVSAAMMVFGVGGVDAATGGGDFPK